MYVAAIAAHHDAVDGKSVGKHDLVIRFLRGARKLNPLHPHLVPSWDLPSFLTALKEETPLRTSAVSRAYISVVKDGAPHCIGLGQEGRGPAGIFGRRFVPRIWTG